MFTTGSIIIGTVSVAAFLFLLLLRRFILEKHVVAIIFFPLITFVLGFSLRLAKAQGAVDVGFFFTEFSFLFVYLLFALSFLLGQIKYWKLAQPARRRRRNT